MPSQAIVLLLLSIFAFQALGERPSPVDPAYAADQPKMTAEAIGHEAAQFRALAQWHSALDQLETAKIKNKFLKNQFDRAAALKEGGHITFENYVIAKYKFDASSNDLIRLEVEASQAKASMQVSKLRLLDQGDPNTDYRREIVVARIEEVSHQIKGLGVALATFEMEQKLTQAKAQNGRKLGEGSSLSAMEMETRLMACALVDRQIESLRNQIAAAKQTLKGLELSKARIDREADVVPVSWNK